MPRPFGAIEDGSVRYLLAPGRSGRSGWMLPVVRDGLLALTVASTMTSVIGYGLGVPVSRRLLLVQAVVTLVLESLLVGRARAVDETELRLAVVCDDAEFVELARAVDEYSADVTHLDRRTRISVSVRLVGLL